MRALSKLGHVSPGQARKKKKNSVLKKRVELNFSVLRVWGKNMRRREEENSARAGRSGRKRTTGKMSKKGAQVRTMSLAARTRRKAG